MKYKNTKTGAIVDSPFVINGENWKKLSDVKVEEPNQDSETEYVEEEVDLEAMTNNELEEFAKEHDVELSSDDKKNKQARIAAITKAFE